MGKLFMNELMKTTASNKFKDAVDKLDNDTL